MLRHHNQFYDATQCEITLLCYIFHYILCVEMALLPPETSKEYCFSSLHPVSFESSDYLNHC